MVVQADGDAAGVDAEKVQTIFIAEGMDNTVSLDLDCSNSATLWYVGKFVFKPSQHKNEYLTVALGQNEAADSTSVLNSGLLLFCWFTMGVTAAYDSDLSTAYGFPLSWYTPSVISSGGYEKLSAL
jgi:hypothetical protein